jgi:predicted ATPase
LNLIEEIIQTEETKLESWDQPWLRISIKDRVAKLEVRDQSGTVGMDYTKSELDPNATILAQQNAIIRLAFKNSNEPLFAVVGSVLGDLADGFKSIRIFRDWGFGTLAAARRPQGADLPADFLSEDSENLALVLNDLWLDASVQERILDLIREFNRQIVDLEFRVVGGTIQLVVIEGEARRPIPASRVSDGTIKFLALLAILCHPKPPRLICIEEPELGLHPDAIQIVAEMLKEASRRTQLIVTTHSSSLVSALSDVPEAVMVCERDFDGSTTLRRLEADRLKKWLNDYSLGDLWLMGELGGTH